MKPVTLRQAIKNVIKVFPGAGIDAPKWPEPKTRKRRRQKLKA